jgi:TolB-like protein/class 3 adenylate cyclase
VQPLIPFYPAMAEDDLTANLAVILHADVADSTALVQQDKQLAHERIQDSFQRFGETIEEYNGQVLELRGDALLAEFKRASDAVAAALTFQTNQADYINHLDDDLHPAIRVGIAMGEIIVANRTVTGAGVVQAQRIEQLAKQGGVCIAATIRQALSNRMPLDLENLGDQSLKGFDHTVGVYRVTLKPGQVIPPAQPVKRQQILPKHRKQVIAFAAMVLLVVGGIIYWSKIGGPLEGLEVAEEAAMGLPARPSIVVLPFANQYDDGEQNYFVDGVTNGIITQLSKFPELFVISSTTAFTYQGKSVRVTDIGRDLGVKYVLEGSVQRGAENLIVHVQLIDATTDSHVWAEQYDVPPDAVFQVQGDLISKVVGTLKPALWNEAKAAISKRPATNLEGYDLYLKALSLGSSKEERVESLGLLNRAVSVSPDFLDAHYALSEKHLGSWRFGSPDDPDETLRLARLHAAKAMEIDHSDYRGHLLQGQLHLFADHDHDLALVEMERALSDNPNDTYVLYYMGFLKFLMGQAKEAIEWNNKAKRINPRYPAWYNFNAALAHVWVGDYEKALVLAKTGIAAYPKSLAPRRILIVTLVEMGRLDEAKQQVTELLSIRPNFRLSTFHNTPFKHQADQDRYFDAMRKAGIPD